MPEEQLDGGIANAGKVVRVGPHVLRPSSPHTGSIHAFLRSVRQAGFEGASFPVGVDADGHERLVFIEGEVPVPPYPDWSQSDAELASIARLLRGLHDAARAFDPQGHTWDDSLADPAGGTFVCHNDVCPENVVFAEGVAVLSGGRHHQHSRGIVWIGRGAVLASVNSGSLTLIESLYIGMGREVIKG